ncbi:uncharacterized protein SEPMUDRAFT_85431 [Sphaerulina musiva SO2202]|uniref:DUF1330 domain-containing protein n=1 Tax=Sphaerulina musiva (strain SO2202) TaxID=692275 RepID=M3D3H3_SPHMS|nr:uncharacterized protein SEPMUDRAFT_85431 [Sphaerulina musiva SO2202]EMF12439.1 hypothetical protein SEPMUDRAFT_85431 [Sphaerulina musiva SO2202]
MPLTTLYLLSLAPNTSISQYLRALNSYPVKPLITAKPVRWIITPEKFSPELLETTWDLFLILDPSTSSSSSPSPPKIPQTYLGKDWIKNSWTLTAGIPSSLLQDFSQKNSRLLYPQENNTTLPNFTGSLQNPLLADSSQKLELSPDLLDWSQKFSSSSSSSSSSTSSSSSSSRPGQNGAVSMLNLLAFWPGKEAHESYLQYGKAFGESIGKRRGGKAKIVGKVVRQEGEGDHQDGWWDEVALAHYPTIHHFTDMLASEDYQKVNHEFRLPALKDTCILCTTELDSELSIDEAKL